MKFLDFESRFHMASSFLNNLISTFKTAMRAFMSQHCHREFDTCSFKWTWQVGSSCDIGNW